MKQHAPSRWFAIAALILAALALAPGSALAYRVYSPNVTPDETALGFWGEATGESASTNKPESKRGQVELRHTFLERLDLGVAAVAESGAGSTPESIGYSRLKVRGVWQITEPKAHFLDLGLYADYQIISGSIRDRVPDYLNVFVLLEKDFGTWYVNFNPGIRKKMSNVAGVDDNVAEYQAGFKYRYHPLFNPGIEAYGVNVGEWGKFSDTGQQVQYAGPAFHGDLPKWQGFTVHYEGALLMGLTKASYDVLANGVLEIRF